MAHTHLFGEAVEHLCADGGGVRAQDVLLGLADVPVVAVPVAAIIVGARIRYCTTILTTKENKTKKKSNRNTYSRVTRTAGMHAHACGPSPLRAEAAAAVHGLDPLDVALVQRRAVKDLQLRRHRVCA
jgi:hypothetical protein